MARYDPATLRTAERLVHTGITGIYRLCKAYGDQIDALYLDDPAMSDYCLEHLSWELDDVERALAHARQSIAEKQAAAKQRARIAALRETTGRTPREAALYQAKADALEAGQRP